ncbi:amidohydrolase family protein [Pseudomarimonas salicorniae]|uniref:Amidohydrolase family protein n=1 Tax=Pseudomarimonas salicorniae TaxID=2933270 RepID=A0ABT0GDM8_9GAMM|nr:amidohydrolase family protein [Lysobacter sp. CAU 1642]MCK7592636.1 amidohydrolase family protein [Lysobacter sp. CAU 1642]
MTPRLLCLALAAALLPPAALAAKKDDKKDEWSVETSLAASKTIRFDTDEGTWMNLDVSPDGRRIVFDLLGDLYLLPIEGGKATRLTSGRVFDVQPRFSPDGRQVAFTSDRDGANNLWRIDVDGKNPVQVSKEDFRLLNNPAWTADGEYLIGRKHFTGMRSAGAGELWMYHVSGGHAGLQLTKQKNDQQDQGEPAVSPDGRYVYFSEDVSPGPSFQYNKDPHGLIYAIRRLDRESGEVDDVVRSPGGAVRPQPSPDGRSLAFVKRVRDKSVLHLLDLESGVVRPLWDGMSHDQQEGWAIFGPYPNYDWLPDGSALVVWAQGGFWKVDAGSGEASRIPFTAEVEQKVAEPLRFEQKLDDSVFAPKMIRDVATSPDGRLVVFHAVGKLWTRTMPSGKPQRLTTQAADFEYQPSFSPDGRKLVYTRWNDADLVRVIERDLASGSERELPTGSGYFYGPRYAPNGRDVVYAKTSGSELTGRVWAKDPGIYLLRGDSKAPARIAREGRDPQFNADGNRVFYFTGSFTNKESGRKLMSVGLAGEEPRQHFSFKYPDAVSLSPDGRWIAFSELFNAYVAPLPATGGSVELSKDSKAVPVAKISHDAGSYLHWSDSDSLHWTVGNQYYTRDLKDAFAFLPDAPKTLPKPADLRGVELGLSQPVYQPEGRVALVGGRVITMRDAENTQEVIEDGVVLVAGDEIVAVGPRSEVRVPDGTRVIDVSGKTVFPGIVDAHAHAAHFGGGVIPQQNWAYYANLAFGVTTMHDPSASNEFVFSQSELVKTGEMVGPRVMSTGTILYGADFDFKAVVDSLDDARSHLRRMKALGAFSVKSYNQPRRNQHQQINQAARELEMLVVEEGGATFFHNIPMVLDGATGIEHNLPIAPLYKDVVQLMAQTDVRNTPTLVVSYGGLSGERWFYSRDNVFEDEKLNRFFPRETLAAQSIRREIAPDWDYYHIEVARAAKVLRDAGVKIQVGGHGQMQGLAPHWETWMLVQGGFSNFEALRAATIDGADYLGFGKQLGSLEPGKRADLVVVDGNPLEDIRDTDDTTHVMVNGRLFDTATMAEIGGREAPAPTFHWQRHRAAQSFGLNYGPTAVCHCPKGNHRH